MMPHRDKLHSIFAEIRTHLDEPDWLSGALIDLSAILVHTSVEIAQAQFREESEALECIDRSEGKKMSVSEAEKRAKVLTGNQYKELTLEREAIVETINSIKKRIEVLSYEFKQGSKQI